MRAPTVELKIRWFNAIKDAQMKAQSEFEALSIEQLQENTRNNPQINPKIKHMLLDTSQEKMEKLLVGAFEGGARFDETLSELLPLITTNEKRISNLVEKLQDEAHFI